jgi:hypothetical protein
VRIAIAIRIDDRWRTIDKVGKYHQSLCGHIVPTADTPLNIERLLPKVWDELGHFSRALDGTEKRDLERLLKKLLTAFEAEH